MHLHLHSHLLANFTPRLFYMLPNVGGEETDHPIQLATMILENTNLMLTPKFLISLK